jgi:energy-coupling factor transporter ATP-binding protein EcfA2
MTKKAPRTKKLTAENIGPIREFSCEVSAGINLLTGHNGAGKSEFLKALARAGGSDIPVEVRDSAARGKFSIDGSVILELTRSKSKVGGMAEINLASVSPLAAVIDPGIKDPKAAEAARIRALVSILNLKTSEKLISELVQGDESAVDFLFEDADAEEWIELDPVAASSQVHKALHKKKRELEDEAAKAEGRRVQAMPVKPATLTQTPFLEAQKSYDKAIGDKREAMGSAGQRKEREEERLIIEETLGERPDLAQAEADYEAAKESLRVVSEHRNGLEAQIAKLQGQLDGAIKMQGDRAQQAINAGNRVKVEEKRAADWDRKKSILDSEITGSTQADVEAADKAVVEARRLLETARESEEYRKRCEQAEEARTQRDSYTTLAAKYEALAKEVPRQLGGLLEKAGVASLTVLEGELQYIHEGGELEPVKRLSAGQKARLFVPIWVANNPSRLCALPEDLWVSLEKESQDEVAKIFEEYDVIAITEMASFRGDPLKVEKFEVQS